MPGTQICLKKCGFLLCLGPNSNISCSWAAMEQMAAKEGLVSILTNLFSHLKLSESFASRPGVCLKSAFKGRLEQCSFVLNTRRVGKKGEVECSDLLPIDKCLLQTWFYMPVSLQELGT